MQNFRLLLNSVSRVEQTPQQHDMTRSGFFMRFIFEIPTSLICYGALVLMAEFSRLWLSDFNVMEQISLFR